MRKIQIIILLVVFLFSISQCTKSPTEPYNKNIRELTSVEKSLVESDNRFGLKLFQEIVKTQKDLLYIFYQLLNAQKVQMNLIMCVN